MAGGPRSPRANRLLPAPDPFGHDRDRADDPGSGIAPRRGEPTLALYLRWHQLHEDAQVRLTGRQGRPGPTAEELLSFAASLPPAQARDLLGRARIAMSDPSVGGSRRPEADPGPAAYLSWEDFLVRTRATEVMAWCRAKPRKPTGDA
jgi:hypothetical protein